MKIMAISIDSERAFEKTQYPFMIKSLQQIGYRRNIPQQNTGHIKHAHI